MTKAKIYLAGPDVFVRKPKEIFAKKKQICARYGLIGVSPLDSGASAEGKRPFDAAMDISRANERLMDACDVIIANMAPFHGPSMDIGTAYEMGYMRAKGKIVLGYSCTREKFFDRVRAFFGGNLQKRDDGLSYEDSNAMQVENFGLEDNLMVVGAVRASRGEVETDGSPSDCVFDNLVAFERCTARARELLGD